MGTRFIVDIDVSFTPESTLTGDKISNTVDYELLYELVCEEMKHPRKLIETVAQAIIDKIKAQYPLVENIKVSLKKLNPPLSGKVGYSAVTMSV